MNSQKADNQLNLALDLPNSVREKTIDLNVGFSEQEKTWEVIVKYQGNLDKVKEELRADVTELLNQYAIIIIGEDEIERLPEYPEILYIEKPRRLFYEVDEGIDASCIRESQGPPFNLTGKGVIVGIIDSGIDYAHPDFRNEDGTTRILSLWDQTIQGDPPEGYSIGSLFTEEEINRALQAPTMEERLSIVPSIDVSGHGTHVTGIAAGNGRASNGRFRGVAFDSKLIVVKLGASIGSSFPKTTQVMEALNYMIRFAIERNQPISINMSFGNNYGSHAGNSLLETYIDEMADIWKTNIVVGTGNEGGSGKHTEGVAKDNEEVISEVIVSDEETSLNIQFWKNSYDFMDIILESPSGLQFGPINRTLGTQNFILGDTRIYLYYGEPSPYRMQQEIYFEFIPVREFITPGIWKIKVRGTRIVDGIYHMWLPAGGSLNLLTKFNRPSIDTTLTIPSTATRVISVGAYNAQTDSYAVFSGRGFTTLGLPKPDLVAPGVNITSTAPGGGYTRKSGTSMATPFVTGTCALYMQWGIVEKNDIYLYGEKTKAYLIANARELPSYKQYPNPAVGFGALCFIGERDFL